VRCSSHGGTLLSSHTQPYSSYMEFTASSPTKPTYTSTHPHTHTEERVADAHYSHSGDVLSRKGIRGVTDQQAGLPYSSAEDESDKHKGG